MKLVGNLDFKSIITLSLTFAIIAATFYGILDPKDALTPLAFMVFTYYFTKKESNKLDENNDLSNNQQETWTKIL